ncbi:MAG: hypothetical protein NXH75_04935 [Halobacteriovoraceae bacterium]|nr:hypothetical protein [Halobacteriovoraceae bacterium]
MIITKTPFRLSFFGGGTDYNSWFEENGGLIIGSTFSKYNYISVRSLPPFFMTHTMRLVYSKVEEVFSAKELEHPSARNALNFLGVDSGIEIHYDGDLPARSGIGSSSSFTVGILHALHAFKGEMISKMDLAKEAIYIEQTLSEENVGIQDQILTAVGGLNTIEMGPGKKFHVSPLIIKPDFKKYLESCVMLGFSGITRFSSDAAGAQINNIKNGKNTSSLSEISSIAKDALQLFSNKESVEEIGKLLDQTWQIKKGLTSVMSNGHIDEAYNTAIKNGAFGGRLLGAGGGGFLFFLAPPEKHQQIRDALKELIQIWIPFQFEEKGTHILTYENDSDSHIYNSLETNQFQSEYSQA